MKFVLLIFIVLNFVGCTKKDTAQNSAALTTEQLVERGQSIYKLNCIACHNTDPSKDGTTGPAISGSSLELLQARVMRAQYPEGYKAKRDSKVMPALPHLEKELSALHSYLNSIK